MNRTSMLRSLSGVVAAAALISGCVVVMHDNETGARVEPEDGEDNPDSTLR